MKVSKHFDIRELVPPIIYKRYGSNSIWFIDPRLIRVCEEIRRHFAKPMIINNWHKGGNLMNRGYRTPTSSIGAKYSQHKMGRAVDFNIAGIDSDTVNVVMAAHYHVFAITALEDKLLTKTWTHIDIRHTGNKSLLIVRPKVMAKQARKYNSI